MKGCSVEGCDRPFRCRQLCAVHYDRWRRHGDPTVLLTTPKGELLAWLAKAMLLETDDCIEWPYTLSTSGYGIVRYQGRQTPAHALALILSGQPKPDAPQNLALHWCDNPPCVNVRHLRWGSNLDNAADRVARERGRHPNGENHYRAKLNEQQVREIRRRWAMGESQVSLGAAYGVDRNTIAGAVHGKTWRCVA